MKHIKKIFIITVCVAMSLMILVSCSNAPSADGIALAAEKGPVTSDEAKITPGLKRRTSLSSQFTRTRKTELKFTMWSL